MTVMELHTRSVPCCARLARPLPPTPCLWREPEELRSSDISGFAVSRLSPRRRIQRQKMLLLWVHPSS